jgi:hypothetical protein
VEAGAWRRHEEHAEIQDVIEDIGRDPRFPSARQEAHLVRGDGMNAAGITIGGYVRVVCYEDAHISLRPGMIVLVERRFDGEGLFERTLKEVEILSDGGYRLVPRSHNPKHETFVIPAGQDPADENAKIRVIGFVTAFVQPIGF